MPNVTRSMLGQPARGPSLAGSLSDAMSATYLVPARTRLRTILVSARDSSATGNASAVSGGLVRVVAYKGKHAVGAVAFTAVSAEISAPGMMICDVDVGNSYNNPVLTIPIQYDTTDAEDITIEVSPILKTDGGFDDTAVSINLLGEPIPDAQTLQRR